MSGLAMVLSIILVLVCLFLITVVLLQKGKAAGLTGAIGGAAESYWGKNKASSMEGKFEKLTIIVATLFIVLSLVLYFIM